MPTETQAPPSTLPSDFSGWDSAPSSKATGKPPDTLPADFSKWDSGPVKAAPAVQPPTPAVPPPTSAVQPPQTLPADHTNWDKIHPFAMPQDQGVHIGARTGPSEFNKPMNPWQKAKVAFSSTETGRTLANSWNSIKQTAANVFQTTSEPILGGLILGRTVQTPQDEEELQKLQKDFIDKHVPDSLVSAMGTIIDPAYAPLWLSKAGKQALRGGAQGGLEFTEQMTSPQQIALMVGTFGENTLAQAATKMGLPKLVPAAKAVGALIQSEFISEMVEGSYRNIHDAIPKFVSGDWESGTQLAVQGLTSAVMAKMGISHIDASERVRADLNRTAREMHGANFDHLTPENQGLVIDETVRRSPEYKAIVDEVGARNVETEKQMQTSKALHLAKYEGLAYEHAWNPDASQRAVQTVRDLRKKQAEEAVRNSVVNAHLQIIHEAVQKAAERRAERARRAAEDEEANRVLKAQERQDVEANRAFRKVELAEKRTPLVQSAKQIAEGRNETRKQRAQIANVPPPEETWRPVESRRDQNGHLSYVGTYIDQPAVHGVAIRDGQHSVYRQTGDRTEWLDKSGIFVPEPTDLYTTPDEETADALARIASVSTTADTLAEQEGAPKEAVDDSNELDETRKALTAGEIDAERAKRKAGIAQVPEVQDEFKAAMEGQLGGPFAEQRPSEFQKDFEQALRESGASDEEIEASLDSLPDIVRAQTESNLHHIHQSGDYILSKKGVRWILDSKGMLHPDNGGPAVSLMKRGKYSSQAMRLAASGKVGYGAEDFETKATRLRWEKAAGDAVERVDNSLEQVPYGFGAEPEDEKEARRRAFEQQEGRRGLPPPPGRREGVQRERVGRFTQEPAFANVLLALQNLDHAAIEKYLKQPDETIAAFVKAAKEAGVPVEALVRVKLMDAPDPITRAIAGLNAGDQISDAFRKSRPWRVVERSGAYFIQSGDARLPLDRINPSERVRQIVSRGTITNTKFTPEPEYHAPSFAVHQEQLADEVRERMENKDSDPAPRTERQLQGQIEAAERRSDATESIATRETVKALNPTTQDVETAVDNVDRADQAVKLAEEAYAQQVEVQGRAVPEEKFPQRPPVSIGYRGAAGTIVQNNREFPFHYELLPVGLLTPSHRWEGNVMVPVDKYPEALQPRTVSEAESQQNAMRAQPGTYDIRQLMDKTINATMGPPIVDRGGLIPGGNTRFNIFLKHIENLEKISDPEERQASINGLKANVRQWAEESGINRMPGNDDWHIVVRMLDKPIETMREAADLGRLFNKSVGVQITQSAKGISYSKSLDADMLDRIGQRVEANDGIIPAMEKDPDFFKEIVTNQFGIMPEEYADWFNTDEKGIPTSLNDMGRSQFIKALLGTVVRDTSVLNRIEGKTAYRSLARALNYILKMKAIPDRDITDKILEAVQASADTQGTDPLFHTSRDVWKATYQRQQGELLGLETEAPPEPDRMVEAVWRALHASDVASPRVLSDRLKSFIGEETSEGWLMGATTAHVEQPYEAFNRAFEKQLKEVAYSRGDREEELSKAEYEAALRNREVSPEETGLERRRPETQALRKRIDQMTSEEKSKALLTSRKTGLPNMIDFEEHNDPALGGTPAPIIARSDIDGLKAFNDRYGYDAGDKLLKAKADALRAVGVEAYHDKGDEFVYRANSVIDLSNKLAQAREILRNTPIEVKEKNGTVTTYKGVDFSFGIGKDLEEAEEGQHAAKAERKTARGEMSAKRLEPPPTTRIPEQTILDIQHEEQRLLKEGVMAFASGVNRVADLEGFAKAGVPIGIDVSSVSPAVIARIKELNVPVFVDSGAFSEMEFGPAGPVQAKPISDEEWERRLGIYKDLAETLHDKVSVVAPDMVGNQRTTLWRIQKFGKQLRELKELGARIIVPLQGGSETNMEDSGLDEMWMEANHAAGFDIQKPLAPGEPEVTKDFSEGIDYSKALIPGFPLKKAALSPNDVTFFVRLFKPPSIHLLGMGASNRLAEPLIRMLHEQNPGMEITMDSNALRAQVGEGRPVTEAERQGASREESIAGAFEKKKIGGQLPKPPKPTEVADRKIAIEKADQGYITSTQLLDFLQNHPATKDHAPELMRTAQMMAEYVYDADPPEGVSRKEALDWILKERVARIEAGNLKGRRGEYSDPHIEKELGTKILKLHKTADPTSFVHEFAHVIFPFLSDEDLKAIDSIGEKRVWDGKAASLKDEAYAALSEKLAHGVERFLRDQNPRDFTAEVKQVLAKIKDIFRKVYLSFKSDPLAPYTLSSDSVELFDSMFHIAGSDVPDSWREEVKKARAAEKKIAKPEAQPHPILKIARDLGATGITDTIEGKVVDEVGTRVDPTKHTAVLVLPSEEKAIEAFNQISTKGSKIEGAQLIQGEGDTWGIRINTPTSVTKTILRQELPERHPGLQLEDLEERLKKMPAHMLAQRKLLELQINNLKNRIRADHGVEERKPEPTLEAAKEAVQESKDANRGRKADDGVPGLPQPPRVGGIPKPPDIRQPERAATGAGSGRARGRASESAISLENVKPVALQPMLKERGTPVGLTKDHPFDQAKWTDGLRRGGLPENLPAPTRELDPKTAAQLIYPGQKQIVQTALSALEQGDGVAIISPPGTGKTYHSAAIVKETLLDKPNANILFITKNRSLYRKFKRVGEGTFGFDVSMDAPDEKKKTPGVYATSYMGLLNNEIYKNTKWDLVLADESGEARRFYDEKTQQGDMLRKVIASAEKAVYLSATPFHSPMEYGYLDKLNMWPKGRFGRWLAENFKHRVVNGEVIAELDPAKQAKLREQLIERGQLIPQNISYDGYTAHFGVVPITHDMERGLNRIRVGFDRARQMFEGMGKKGLARKVSAFEAVYTKNFLERSRLPQAIELAKQAIDQGWQVLVFSEHTSDDLFRRERMEGEDPSTYQELDDAMGGGLSRIIPPYASVFGELNAEFGDLVGDFSGRGNTEAAREKAKNDFLKGDLKMLYTSYAGGGIGVDMHDADYPDLEIKGGDKPRIAIYLGPPYSGVLLEQAMGRPWRFGTKSNVQAVFLGSDAEPEIRLMQTKIGPRMKALRAAVVGEKDSLADVMQSYTDEEKVRERQEQLAFAQGNEVKMNPTDMVARRGRRVGIQSWDQIHFPSAEEAKNKGMKYGDAVTGGDWSTLYQDAEALWKQPPPTPETIEGAKVIDAIGDSIASGEVPPPLQNLEPAERDAQVGAASAIAADAVALKADRDPESVAKSSMKWGLNIPKSMDVRFEERRGRFGRKKMVAVWRYPEGVEPTNKPVGPFEELPLDSRTKYVGWGVMKGGIESIARQAGTPEVGLELSRMIGSWQRDVDIIESQFRWYARAAFEKNGLDFRKQDIIAKVMAVAEGNEISSDPAINKTAQEMRDWFGEASDAAVKEGVKKKNQNGQWVPFKPLENYWTHIIDWKAELEYKDPQTGEMKRTSLRDAMKHTFPEDARREMIIKLANAAKWSDDGKPVSAQELDRYLRQRYRKGTPIQPNVQTERTINFPIVRKDFDVLTSYSGQIARAIATERYFGSDRGKLLTEIAKIPSSNGRKDITIMFDSMLSPQELSPRWRAFSNAMTAFTALSKMSLSFAKVPFHSVHMLYPLHGDVRPMVKGIADIVLHGKRQYDEAVFLGTLARQVDFTGVTDEGQKKGPSHLMFELTGFNSAYNVGRIWASATARNWMEDYAMNGLKKGGSKATEVRRILRNTMLMGDQAIDQAIARGSFSREDIQKAQVAFANEVMFTDNPMEMPAWARGHIGRETPGWEANFKQAARLAYSMASFTVKTRALLRKHIIDEAFRYNNPKMLALFAAFEPIVGASVWTVSSAIRAGVQKSVEKATGQKHQKNALQKEAEEFEKAIWGPGGVKKLAQDAELYIDLMTAGIAQEQIKLMGDMVLNIAADPKRAKQQALFLGGDILENVIGPIWTSSIVKPLDWSKREVDILTGKGHKKGEKTLRSTAKTVFSEFPITTNIPQVQKFTKPPK